MTHISTVLFEEHFVGIALREHPNLKHDSKSLETFICLSYALTTLRRDTIGGIDQALSQQSLGRRILLITHRMLVLPFVIASSNLLAAIHQQLSNSLPLGNL